MAYRLKEFTDEELITRVWDQEDIRNLISRFTYFEAANRRAEAMERFWVSSPELRATASFGRNWGFIEEYENIRSYYVDRCRFGGVGTMLMHPLSTKLVCEAEDGKTAQGIWMGIAYEIAPNAEEKPEADWVNERMAVDFVKEDGVWKIWHMFVGTCYVVPVGGNYGEQPLITRTMTREQNCPDWYNVGTGRQVTEGLVARFDQIPAYAERETFLNGKQPEEVYTALYNEQYSFPRLPEEYRTFRDTIGCDRSGWERLSRGYAGCV